MKRSEQIGVRLSPEEKRAVEELAKLQHKTPSDFCRDLILAEVGRLLVSVDRDKEKES